MNGQMLTQPIISSIVYQHTEEIKKEIEKEFIDIMRSNIIRPNSEGVVFFGKSFAFKYVKTRRFKHIIQLIFEVYGAYETQRYYNYSTLLGKVIVSVRIKGDPDGF